jgi:hypothetical protein
MGGFSQSPADVAADEVGATDIRARKMAMKKMRGSLVYLAKQNYLWRLGSSSLVGRLSGLIYYARPSFH